MIEIISVILELAVAIFKVVELFLFKKEKERQVVFQNSNLGKEKNTVTSGAFLNKQ